MKVLLTGATGRLGKYLLPKLLEKGYAVTVLARDPSDVTLANDNLTVVAGDVLDAASVAAAMARQDAVVNSVGGTLEDRVRSRGLKNILAAMSQAGTSRLITLAGMGIMSMGDEFLFEKSFFPEQLKSITEEHKRGYDQLVTSSGVDWTQVCPPVMTDDPATGQYQTQADQAIPGAPFQIPLADVADFIVSELVANEYVGHRVAIVLPKP